MAWQVYAKDKDGKVRPERWTNDARVVRETMVRLENDPMVAEAWYEEEK